MRKRSMPRPSSQLTTAPSTLPRLATATSTGLHGLLHHVLDLLFGGLARRMYGLNDAQLATVFPGASARDLGLV